MPVQWNERPIGSVPYITNTTQVLVVPRDKPIRRITMRVVLSLTTTATAPTYTEDDMLNVIKKIRLVMNGNDNKFNVNARLWFYVEQYEKGTQVQRIAPTTTISTTADAVVTLIADFAQDRKNEDDFTALLPARRLSSLNLEIDWGGTTDIATANAPTINVASKIIVEIREAFGTVEEYNEKGEVVKSTDVNDLDYLDIREGMDTLLIDANYSSYDNSSLKKNVIPAPSTILTNAFLVRDATAPAGNKSNALVTDLKIQRESPFVLNILQRTWLSIWGEIKAEYSIEATQPVGFLYIDYVDKFSGGLVNNGNEGDIKYRFLNTGFVSGQAIDIFTRSVSTAFKR